MNLKQLNTLLDRYEVPYREWEQRGGKTSRDLLTEVRKGEAVLEQRDEQLIMVIKVVSLNVFFWNGSQIFQLKEDRQEFMSGKILRRHLEHSIFEKIVPDESVDMAIRRALHEELGIMEKLYLTGPVVTTKTGISVSYPGLMARSHLFIFWLFLPASCFRPEGYIERQKEKTNYYVWVPCEP